MTEDRTSAGDPGATLRLLWRAHAPADADRVRRGPKRALSVDQVVEAATAIADEQGLPSLTMRHLADHLGTRTMTLYTYVPGRAELLDLMLDDAFARMPRGPDRRRAWQQRVRRVADDNRDLYVRHPWAAAVATLRPPLGPGQMAKYEHELSAFDDSGLDDLTIDDSLQLVLTFVRANARDRTDAERARHASGGSDEQWWAAVGPMLAEVIDAQTYPRATRIGTAAGSATGSAHDPVHAYEFGLDRIVSELQALAGRGRSGRTRR